MKKKEKNSTMPEMSKSKAKREERNKEVAKSRRKKRIGKICTIAVCVAIAAVVIYAAGINIYKSATRTKSGNDFSACLTADGKIEGIDVSSALTLADYENMVVPMDEVAATDEEVDSDINSTLESYAEFNEDSSLTVADGDTVNIDYVGTIDGAEFEGGSSNGEGHELTIGSGSFVDDFEQQLIGSHPGDELTVEVTFPDDYSGADVAGKDASFAVTVHSIKVTPELTDEFVAENLSDKAASADEYRASVEDKFYKEHLTEYVTNYVLENSTVNTYPSKYVKAVKSLTKYDDEYMMQYYNQMFSSYGMASYENVWDIRGEEIDDELSYEKELTTRAKDTVKTAMVYQAIYEKAGLSVNMDEIKASMKEENGEEYLTNMEETYGDAYMAQAEIKNAVIDYLVDTAKVE